MADDFTVSLLAVYRDPIYVVLVSNLGRNCSVAGSPSRDAASAYRSSFDRVEEMFRKGAYRFNMIMFSFALSKAE